ncbi:MAG: DoxX family protein [Ancrocorticia sp.]
MSILRALARPLLATPFVVSGIDALIRPANHRERAENVAPLLDKAGYPLTEKQMDRATRALGLTNVLCGAALAVGKFPRFSALVLAATEVPVALANNPVWLHKGAERRKDLLRLTEAAGLLGGVLLAASDLAGKPSRSWRRMYKQDLRQQLETVRAHERALTQARIAKLESKGKAA